MSVRRIFVEKKPEFAVRAKELLEEIESYLGIDTITGVRVLIRYDIEDVSEEAYQKSLATIFSEPPVDFVYEEDFPCRGSDTVFTVEYLPGQFDQRADSAQQCVKLLSGDPFRDDVCDIRPGIAGADPGDQGAVHQSRGFQGE